MREPAETILVLGASGQLGTALCERVARAGRRVDSPGRDVLDLADPAAAGTAVRARAPGAVLLAAAFTDVAAAQRPGNREGVFRVNRDSPRAIAEACADVGARLVHVSTDYVFDGAKREPYAEDDPPRPLQLYGLSKLEGERAVLSACPHATVVRTSTVFGPSRRRRVNYVVSIARQAASGNPIEVIEAPVSSPTYAPDLAEAILELLDAGVRGVVHVVNDGAASRLDLARATVELLGLGASVPVRAREPIPGDLERPAYSVLGTSRFESVTGRRLRPWRSALEEYLRTMRA